MLDKGQWFDKESRDSDSKNKLTSETVHPPGNICLIFSDSTKLLIYIIHVSHDKLNPNRKEEEI
jgi:hypothetical protein